MPKKTYKLLSFHGGINNDADPRDIADNQFADLQNVAVDEVGKIVVLGDIKTQLISAESISIGMTGTLTGQGNGLFAVSTDHDGFLDFPSGDVNTPGQTYYLVENADTINGIGEDGETGNIVCTIGAAGPTMYYVDGALRIGDADHGGGASPQWRGFIKGKLYGTINSDPEWGHIYNSGTSSSDAWYTKDATIAGCFPEVTFTEDSVLHTVGHNLILGNHWDGDGGGLEAKTFAFAGETVDTGDGPEDTDAGASDQMFWGLGLQINELANGTGTWMPTTTARYQLYATTVYDGKQESLPQLFTMYGSNHLHTNDDYIGATPSADLYFTNDNTHNEIGQNVAVTFSPVIKWHGADWEDDAAGSGSAGIGGGQGYNFGASAVTSKSGGNPRITAVKIYWASNEDGYSNKWLLMEWDFVKGVRPIAPEGGNIGAGGYNLPDSTRQETSDSKDYWYMHVHGSGDPNSIGFKWIDPPKIFLYDDIAGHSPNEVIKVDSFKTAVVANRRTYIGNIEQDGEIHGDRILKSTVDEFDKFPKSGALDIVVEDGDEIVALLEYADRILEFKKNTLYILNVSGDVEFLEAEYKFKGITNPGAACRTDYGCAWVNQNGCYMYDGKQVLDLLEDKGMRKINRSTWSTFISAENFHRIGFNPFKRQLIVLNGTDDSTVLDDAYVYDMVTKSWTFSTSMISDGNTGSNFINDPVDGSLLIFDDGGETVDKWVDTSSVANVSISIKTKDIDFGEPAVRKKIYKVYVTYQGDGTAVTINYGTNGLAPTGTFYITDATGASTGANAADACLVAADTGVNDWVKAELKPSSSINNINSFQLLFDGSTNDQNFAINDISIIYRMKSIK